MLKKLLLAAIVVAALPALGSAHGPKGHGQKGHAHKALHGGIVVDSGHHHLELVAKSGELALYVRDEDDKAEATEKAKATANVLSAGKRTTVTLAPEAGGLLKGAGDFVIAKGSTVVISLTMPDHAPEQARFKIEK